MTTTHERYITESLLVPLRPDPYFFVGDFFFEAPRPGVFDVWSGGRPRPPNSRERVGGRRSTRLIVEEGLELIVDVHPFVYTSFREAARSGAPADRLRMAVPEKRWPTRCMDGW